MTQGICTDSKRIVAGSGTAYTFRNLAIDQIKFLLFTEGPVMVSFAGHAEFSFYKSGIYKGCNTNSVNHMVLLVGYNDNQRYWILKNSYGPYWG